MVLIVFCDYLILYEMNFNIGNIKIGYVILKVFEKGILFYY